MAWPAVAALGVQAVGAAASWWMKNEQARQMRRETDEAVRRLRRQQNETVGEAMVAGGGLGIEWGSSSLQGYLRDMTTEFQREAQWMKDAGYRAARPTQQAAAIGLFADLGGAVVNYGASQNWWQTPALAPAVQTAPQYVPGQGGPLWRTTF